MTLEDVNIKSGNKLKTLAEVLDINKINALDKIDIHLIPSKAVSGKTYFTIETIIKDAVAKDQKVLLLSSRSSLNQQSKMDVMKSQDRHGFVERLPSDLINIQGVDVMTYQNWQGILLQGKHLNMISLHVMKLITLLLMPSSINLQ